MVAPGRRRGAGRSGGEGHGGRDEERGPAGARAARGRVRHYGGDGAARFGGSGRRSGPRRVPQGARRRRQRARRRGRTRPSLAARDRHDPRPGRHRAGAAVHHARPQPPRAAGRRAGGGGARRPQPALPHRRFGGRRRPAGDEAGVRPQVQRVHGAGPHHAGRGGAPGRAEARLRPAAADRRRRCAPRAESRRGAHEPPGQDRGGRGLLPDPVLLRHGDAQALPRLARGLRDPRAHLHHRRHRAHQVGPLGPLDEREPVRRAHPGRRHRPSRRREGSAGRGHPHLRRADRGATRHRRRCRRAPDGAARRAGHRRGHRPDGASLARGA